MSATFKLMVPGPTPLPPQVMKELAEPMIYHRDEEFCQIVFSVVGMLRELLGNEEGDVLLIPASGRGGMEAALVNVFSPGDRILAASNGHFGEIFADMAKRFKLEVVHLQFDWHEELECSEIEAVLGRDSDIKGVLVTHCETSNAVINDIEAVGKITEKYGRLLVVDAVSSLGCTPINMDQWGIDVVISASQKGLMCPAGLSVVGISQRAWEAVETSTSPRYYFDFAAMRKFIEKGQTPVSTPVSLVRALKVALDLMKKETFAKVYQRHDNLSQYIKEEAVKLGYVLYPENDAVTRASGLSAFSLPENINSADLVGYARDEYKTIFAKGLGKNASRVLRVGHMGWFHEEDARHAVQVLKGLIERFGL